MTLLQLILYGSVALSDSQRMQAVIDWKYRDQPDLVLVTAANTRAPVTPWGEE